LHFPINWFYKERILFGRITVNITRQLPKKRNKNQVLPFETKGKRVEGFIKESLIQLVNAIIE
jgi:hypothetical protein